MMSDKGVLYLCATPIGNLEDMTFRAVRVLKEADLIAAEDTRNGMKLIYYFDIHTPITSYHEYNKIEKGHFLVNNFLLRGKNVALITDAGTPGISDPGEELVKMCMESGILVTSLPGACACVTALTISGLSTRRFCFEAFLPSDKKERKRILEELQTETRTIIIYEAPHRLKKTLQELLDVLGNCRISICRELTKKYETVVLTTLEQAVAIYEQQEPRGEYVLILEGRSYQSLVEEKQRGFQKMDLEEHMRLYEKQGFSRKEAMKKVADDRGVPKREIYKELVNQSSADKTMDYFNEVKGK